MRNNPKWTWRQRTPFVTLLGSMAVGLLFGIWGKNPLNLFDILRNHPQNVLFLWISTTAFLVTTVLSYALYPLARAEATRKEVPGGKESPSLWYESGNTIQVSRLGFWVVLPALCLTEIFLNMDAISHLDIFSWLVDVTGLVFIVADSVAVVLIIRGYRKRAREREMEQQATM